MSDNGVHRYWVFFLNFHLILVNQLVFKTKIKNTKQKKTIIIGL